MGIKKKVKLTKKHLKSTKILWKQLKILFWLAVGCAQYPKSGQNTSQPLQVTSKRKLNFAMISSRRKESFINEGRPANKQEGVSLLMELWNRLVGQRVRGRWRNGNPKPTLIIPQIMTKPIKHRVGMILPLLLGIKFERIFR